ncbi:hypothetical protein BKM31_00605 [[Actinomadura] parvosata subsp. kistnae]|uniref:Uncharacterized protein n=1 Tax=[Actinomadura] parvosata subsp. kistnae TaxID=1909395 RepID=A0A1U9ZQH5_9ACTN|nr:hypothetical protein BKM31_00605 [Nonomuraea sp. ATCC 55076]
MVRAGLVAGLASALCGRRPVAVSEGIAAGGVIGVGRSRELEGDRDGRSVWGAAGAAVGWDTE